MKRLPHQPAGQTFPFQRIQRWYVHVKSENASPAERLELLWLLDEDFAAPFNPTRSGPRSAVWLGATYSVSLGEWFTNSLQSPANPTGAQLFILTSVVLFFLWGQPLKQNLPWEAEGNVGAFLVLHLLERVQSFIFCPKLSEIAEYFLDSCHV